MAKKKKVGRPKSAEAKEPFPIRLEPSLIDKYRNESEQTGDSIGSIMRKTLKQRYL
jgi:uncharacterized protein (DUF4415 family)